MAISLQKGQRIDLTKGNSSLSKLMVGLGWDPVKQGGGLFSIFQNQAEIDCDASVIMLNGDKFVNKEDLIYFGNKKSKCNAVIHSGDNLTGEGDGDDENIGVELKKIPSSINRLVFVVNIYDCVKRRQHFGMIQNCYIRIMDMQGRKELCRFNLSENYTNKTALIAGEIYRHGQDWKFNAVGEATNDTNLSSLVERFI